MKHVIDSCALLNLSNGQILKKVLSLPDKEFVVGSQVRDEVPTMAAELDCHIHAGAVTPFDDDLISADHFLAKKDEWRLGGGETECLIVAQIVDGVLVCDDLAARTVASALIGPARVTGSIGLLRQCVALGLLSKKDAYCAYENMKERGGFLPTLSIDQMFP